MATQIARKGRTVTVEIPEDLLRKAKLSIGDAVEWTLISTGGLALRGSGSADEYEQWKQNEVRAGFDEIEAGESVPGENVIEWLRSWGSTRELPPPL